MRGNYIGDASPHWKVSEGTSPRFEVIQYNKVAQSRIFSYCCGRLATRSADCWAIFSVFLPDLPRVGCRRAVCSVSSRYPCSPRGSGRSPRSSSAPWWPSPPQTRPSCGSWRPPFAAAAWWRQHTTWRDVRSRHPVTETPVTGQLCIMMILVLGRHSYWAIRRPCQPNRRRVTS